MNIYVEPEGRGGVSKRANNDFDVEILNFGSADQSNVGNSHPAARQYFSALERPASD